MVFRYARHTDQLDQIKEFYLQVLQLELLGQFESHDGYDGIFLGKQGQDWHLEFTATKEAVEHQFNEDDLLVFYPTTQREYEAVLQNMNNSNVELCNAKNPYWNRHGVLIKDPDGMGVVISDLKVK